MKSPKIPIFLFTCIVLMGTISCAIVTNLLPLAETPAEEPAPTTFLPEQTSEPSPTFTPEMLPTEPEIVPSPIPIQEQEPEIAPGVCEEDVCILEGSFVLKRPIGPEFRNVIDTASRYGTLRRRVRDAYHGVQFLNSTGTPVIAAGAGDVEVAGDDSEIDYGPRPGMYGNLVIVQHAIPGIPVPVFSLYAHLSNVSVKTEGDVESGEQVGLVGMSGSVRGSTLYFEVRYGENTYDATVNPELWLEPLLDEAGNPMGALAGRIVDPEGDFVTVRNIRVENLRAAAGEELRTFFLKTYLDESQRDQSPWGESFAAGDLPEGTYRISFWYAGKNYKEEVEIQPGKLTFVNFLVKK
jgi:murein DD-endopeptidase MepM/ murein hydrolase activator NlpD